MSPVSRKRKGTPKKTKKRKRKLAAPPIFLEYYQPVFYLLIEAIGRSGYDIQTPHPIRNSFWKIVPPGEYSSERARPILIQYRNVLEVELSRLIAKHSLAYWLHIHRRLSPTPFLPDMSPATVAIIRGTVEAAIQKHAPTELCDGIAFSHQVSVEAILDGALMAPEFQAIRQNLKENPQLVLTKFGTAQLIEFYKVEQLCFEVWRCAATLRILGKGAPLRVMEESTSFCDGRSDELDKLVTMYDERARPLAMSATGVVFPHHSQELKGTGAILVPFYNVGQITADQFAEPFEHLFGATLPPSFTTNFIWAPFNLEGYFSSHKPFAETFEKVYDLPLDWVIAIIGTLFYRVIHIWRELGIAGIIRYWQRAYEGPVTRDYVISEIRTFLPVGIEILKLKIDAKEIDVPRIVGFLKLDDTKRGTIDILLGGPHSVFLPVNADRLFIDYAWVHRILYNLFYGVNPTSQHFKGALLEQLVHQGNSALPTAECVALNGQSKQIDAAFEIEDGLVVVECRAVGRSFGVDRGDPDAIQFRTRKIDRALSDIDDKARWLSSNPIGRNYDIRKYKRIIPLAVTPFVEYIPSLNPRYWLTENLPRVLSPSEFKQALENGTIKEAQGKSVNVVLIEQT